MEIIRSFGITTRQASMIPPQSEEWAQLIYADQGVLTVESPPQEQLWFVPARCALWVPAGSPYKLSMRGSVRLRSIYLRRSLCRTLPQSCYAMNVRPLLREIILETVRRSVLFQGEALAKLVCELLSEADSIPLLLPMPHDARARRVAEMLMQDVASKKLLEEFGKSAGASIRTLERLFQAETGMSFAAWRQRLRVLEGVRLLNEGHSVTEAAFATSYESASAFITVFKAAFGKTPRHWIAG